MLLLIVYIIFNLSLQTDNYNKLDCASFLIYNKGLALWGSAFHPDIDRAVGPRRYKDGIDAVPSSCAKAREVQAVFWTQMEAKVHARI